MKQIIDTQQESHEILKETTIYKELKKQEMFRDGQSFRDGECRHHYWIKKCSMCNAILESDSQHNCDPGDRLLFSYDTLDPLVCSFQLALELQELKVYQRSKLYWVWALDENIVTLRLKENVSLKGTRVIAAFTSSELCKLIYRLPASVRTPELFEYVGKNCFDPNRLARMIIKILRTHKNV